MSFRKIEVEFVLSDSSVNVYGFRLCTDGYLMDEFLKNPIGYYGHEKEDGVLLKWEDVRVEGDKILGKPVVNLTHPRAERTIQEIEEGFLNAASVGGIVVLEYHVETESEETERSNRRAEQQGEERSCMERAFSEPVLVVDKWYNKECSLVDSPGNRDAFKVELFDKEENGICVQDLMDVDHPRSITQLRVIEHPLLKTVGELDGSGATERRAEPRELQSELKDDFKSDMNMKKVTLSISPELVILLNLGDAADEGSVLAGIRDLSAALRQAQDDRQQVEDDKQKAHDDLAVLNAELVNERKAVSVAEVKAILDRGLSDGKFTAATRAELEGQFAGNPASLKKLVDTLQPYKAITDRLNTIPADIRDLADKSYDDLDKANMLQMLKEKAPDLYKEKYRVKFGKTPL